MSQDPANTLLTLPLMTVYRASLAALDGKGSACNVGDQCLIPGWGRSSGEGNSYHTSVLALEFHGQSSLVGYS